MNVQDILKAIEGYVRGWIQEMGGTPGSGGYASNPHDMTSSNHTGSISDAQGPQFLKSDGSRMLTGNLGVADGVQVDGVDVSVHKAGTDTHAAATAAAGHAGGVGAHTHQSAAQGGQLDHGVALTGLGDDDHPQYLNMTRHDTPDRHTLGTVVPHDDHSALGGLDADGHPQYLRTDGTRAVSGSLLPDLTDTRDLGASDRLWRKGWVSELDAVVFAKNTQTLIGGYLMIGKGEGTLAADVAAADTQIDFGQAMTAGDFVLFRAAGAVEYVQVGALVSGTIYNVTRNLDGSGANDWPAGGVYAVLGQDGDGRIVLNAIDTPRLQILRQGTTHNLATEFVRLGDLNGSFGIVSALYGIGIGDYANGNYLRYEPVNGFLLKSGCAAVTIDANGIGLRGTDPYTEPVWDGAGFGEIFRRNSIQFSKGDGTPIGFVFGSYNSNNNEAELGLLMNPFNGASINKISSVADGTTAGSEYGSGRDAEALFQAKSCAAALAAMQESRLDLKTYSSSDGSKVPYAELYVHSDSLGTKQFRVMPKGVNVDNQYLPLPDGWAPAGETWTYASAATFTVAGDARAKYPAGAKLKLTQSSTVKYFYVTGTSYTSPNTTVSIGGAKSVPLANATITENCLSYAATPQGYPWTSDWVGPNDTRWVGTAGTPLTSTAWDGDSFSTTAKTQLDLSSAFGTPANIQEVKLFVWVRDSGSAGADTYLILWMTNASNIGVAVDPHTINDRITRAEVVVPCDSNGDIFYQIGASGVSTFDVCMQVIGYRLF